MRYARQLPSRSSPVALRLAQGGAYRFVLANCTPDKPNGLRVAVADIDIVAVCPFGHLDYPPLEDQVTCRRGDESNVVAQTLV